MTKIKVVIPTFNAGSKFDVLLKALCTQKNLNEKDIVIIDSSSKDDTVKVAQKYGVEVISIDQKDFGHGKTRALAVENAIGVDIVVFMTQDVLPVDKNTISNLVDYLENDENLAAVYGKQIPYDDTDIFGKFARIYNYGDMSFKKQLSDKKKYGIKTAFLSDSFAAYKRDIVLKLGNFMDVNFGEDMCMAAKMLMAGYRTGYCADAKVYHSHSYSLREEFTRCRLIGRFHKEQAWLINNFGNAEGEGIKFVISEAKYLLKQGKYYLLPQMFIRNLVKFLAYKFI